MINRVVLVGRLTKDPDYRKTQGKSNTRFTLAVQRTYESSDGQSADFINCVVWNKTAENVEKYCHKGSLVGIDGHLRTRNYESDGQRKYVTEVNCDRVSFLEPKGIKHNDNERTQQKAIETTNSAIPEDYRIENEEMKYFDIEDDDIQF